jgi:SNF2 family DNA or RNA helicase
MGDDWYWDMVIADESSKLKSLRIAEMKHPKTGKLFYRVGGGSKRAGELARIAHKKVNHWVNATGTPMGNGLVDLWGQAWFLDAGQRLGRSFTAFERRWFRSVKIDQYQSILEPYDHSEDEIKAALSDITLTIEAKDYFDLPPTVINRISVPLPPDAYAHYREMEREMFTEIDSNEIEAFNAGAKSMKLRQLANGAAYLQPDQGNDAAEWVTVHDAKIEALQDIVTSLAGEPILVAYYFKSDLARLKKAFPKGVYFDDKPQTLQRFVDGKIPILFIHPKSAAHGIDGMQQACRHVAWFSMIWELEEFQQLIERVGATRQVQSGFYREVYVHLLIGENTIEEEMVDRIESKASVQDAVKAAMKKRGLT